MWPSSGKTGEFSCLRKNYPTPIKPSFTSQMMKEPLPHPQSCCKLPFEKEDQEMPWSPRGKPLLPWAGQHSDSTVGQIKDSWLQSLSKCKVKRLEIHRIVEVGKYLWRPFSPQPSAKAELARAGCLGPRPVGSWIPPRMETAQPLSAASSGVWPLSQ